MACQLLPAERAPPGEKPKPPQGYRLVAVVVTMAYLQCLITAPGTIGSPYFLLVLFATRLLLLSPLLIASMLQRQSVSNSEQHFGNVMYRTHIITIVFAGWYIMEQGAWRPKSLDEAIKVLHRNHAISALGYDLVISLVSLGAYIVLGRIQTT